MVRPEKLYKYQEASLRTLESLRNRIIYFASVNDFNDPLECAFFFRFNEPNANALERIRSYLRENDEKHGHTAVQYREMPDLKIDTSVYSLGETRRLEFLQHERYKYGIVSLSTKKDNLLMWSHYAEKHKGICLEFDTNTSGVFGDARKVKYKTKTPMMDLAPLICRDHNCNWLDLFCTKSPDWSYESEWRIVGERVRYPHEYNKMDLTGVYFGLETSVAYIEMVSLLLAHQNKDVQLWKAQMVNSEYKVIFEKCNYPHSID